MNPFDKILIKTPKSSRFDQRNTNKLSIPAGKMVPIWWKDMSPAEQLKMKFSNIVKTAPMVAPIYDRLKLEVFAFFVPYRLIWNHSEDFFNLSTPVADRPSMPQILGYFGPKSKWVNNSPNYDAYGQNGDLMDYLGYPTYQSYIDFYLQEFLSQENVFVPITASASNNTTGHGMPYIYLNGSWNYGNTITVKWWRVGSNFQTHWFSDKTESQSFSGGDDPGTQDVIMSFTMWVYYQILLALGKVDNTSSTTFVTSVFGTVPTEVGLKYSDLNTNGYYIKDTSYIPNEELYQLAYNVTRYSNFDELYDAYKHYLFGSLISFDSAWTNFEFAELFKGNTQGQTLRASLKRCAFPKRVYWRIIQDWFINTNFENYDDYDNYSNSDYSDTLTPKAYHLFERYWENDYFTSAFASTQSGSDVPIPVNGSIKDLRNANALQRVMELVLYSGKRYIDQIRTFFGAKSSDARLDRAEVLGKQDFVFGIDEISQTSQSDRENPLGSFAGRALTAGNGNLFHYKCEEHGMIMIMACIKPLSSYVGVQDRLLFKTSPYDFLIPQFAQVGEQEIYSDELVQKIPTDPLDIGNVFGYQRRYAEYMFKHNEVHGDFAGNMDYWTMARKFQTVPVLNVDFLTMTASDNLNRAFAVPSAKNHYYCYFAFEFKDVNALPRYLNYDL